MLWALCMLICKACQGSCPFELLCLGPCCCFLMHECLLQHLYRAAYTCAPIYKTRDGYSARFWIDFQVSAGLFRALHWAKFPMGSVLSPGNLLQASARICEVVPF